MKVGGLCIELYLVPFMPQRPDDATKRESPYVFALLVLYHAYPLDTEL